MKNNSFRDSHLRTYMEQVRLWAKTPDYGFDRVVDATVLFENSCAKLIRSHTDQTWALLSRDHFDLRYGNVQQWLRWQRENRSWMTSVLTLLRISLYRLTSIVTCLEHQKSVEKDGQLWEQLTNSQQQTETAVYSWLKVYTQLLVYLSRGLQLHKAHMQVNRGVERTFLIVLEQAEEMLSLIDRKLLVVRLASNGAALASAPSADRSHAYAYLVELEAEWNNDVPNAPLTGRMITSMARNLKERLAPAPKINAVASRQKAPPSQPWLNGAILGSARKKKIRKRSF